MKPTKEQLLDPKWWDENAKPTDRYLYYVEAGDNYFFSHVVDNEVAGFSLIAKRPEPEKWVPKVGEWCEAWLDGEFRKAHALKFHDRTNAIAFDFVDCLKWSSDYRPIKTERDKFIEEAENVIKAHQWTSTAVIEDLYDSGKFKLVEPTK